MIRLSKKQPPVQRSPHITRQKQSTFQYSSNRSQPTRASARNEGQEARNETAKKTNGLWARFNSASIIAGCLITFGVIIYFSLIPAQPQVKTTVQSVAIRDNAEYSQASQELTDNLLSQSKFTINRQKISTELQARFPELSSVEVTTPLFSRYATVELTVARPELVLRNGTDTFLIDNRGVAVLGTQDVSKTKADSFLTVSDQSDTRIEVGKPALTLAQVTFITEVKHQSDAKQLVIESITMTAGGGELAVKYQGMPYFIKYNVNEDARKSFGTFYTTKEFIERTKVTPAEYIDVRIAERAYVK
ncbi:MAG: hypothetical protein ACR2FM_02140 [Candidatus Saccharimonadales bacterium]